MIGSGNRREWQRRPPAEFGVIATLVRPGIAAVLVDLSAGGALIESVHRLLPGRHVELQLRFATRAETVRGRVLRCAIVGLTANEVSYRGAVCFNCPMKDIDGRQRAAHGLPEPRRGSTGHTMGTDYPSSRMRR